MFLLALAILFTCSTVCEAAVDNDSPQLLSIGPNCKELNDKFGDANNAFVQCVLNHNENATFCEDCFKKYAQLTVAFHNLTTGNETDHSKHKGSPCRSRYVDANQLDLVETVYAHSKRLWDIGDCSGKIY